MTRRWPTIALTAVCLAALMLAGWLLFRGIPHLLWMGLALAGAAPIGFLLLNRNHRRGSQGHPVMVSVLAGLGCVLTLVGVQRFGDQHQWITAAALAVLVSWMLYQRHYLRKPSPSASTTQ